MNHVPGSKNLSEVPASIDRVVPLGVTAPTVCPKCQDAMELGEVDNFHVLLCKGCQGILVQSEVFAMLVGQRRKNYSGADSTPSPLDSNQLKRNIKCPGCAQKMAVHPYYGPGNVVVDSCSKCWFTYLDYGELSAIEKAPGRRN